MLTFNATEEFDKIRNEYHTYSSTDAVPSTIKTRFVLIYDNQIPSLALYDMNTLGTITKKEKSILHSRLHPRSDQEDYGTVLQEISGLLQGQIFLLELYDLNYERPMPEVKSLEAKPTESSEVKNKIVKPEIMTLRLTTAPNYYAPQLKDLSDHDQANLKADGLRTGIIIELEKQIAAEKQSEKPDFQKIAELEATIKVHQQKAKEAMDLTSEIANKSIGETCEFINEDALTPLRFFLRNVEKKPSVSNAPDSFHASKTKKEIPQIDKNSKNEKSCCTPCNII